MASASNGTVTSPTDSETVTAVQLPGLSIVKSATPSTYSAVGQVVSYSFVVRNSGNTTLAGPFTVADDKTTNEACPATALLAPGASITCTASYTITQADLDNGSVTNVASASNGTVTSPTDSDTVTAVQSPALSIVKSATPATYSAVGQVVSYSFVVDQLGQHDVVGPFTVADDKTTNEACPVDGLAGAGGVGHLHGVVHDHAGRPRQRQCDERGLGLERDRDLADRQRHRDRGAVAGSVDREVRDPGDVLSAVGQVVSYSFVVANSGNTTLFGPFTVADDRTTDEACPVTVLLVPGASVTCTASYTITQADLDNGSVTNVASASNGTVTSATDSETVTAVQLPGLSIVKSATPSTYSAVGQVVSYSFVVRNSGNTTLAGPFTVADDRTRTRPARRRPCLAPGASITCTASYTITQADLDNGSVTNVASASNGTVTSPTDSETVTAAVGPALSIVKSASPPTRTSAVGQVVSYSFVVRNSGNVTLAGPFTVADDKTTNEACPATASLAPGASITCTASYTITQADLDNGSVTNVASASNGTVTSPTDTATVTAVQSPGLSLDKQGVLDMTVVAPAGRVDVGDRVDYTLTATNTGNVTLTGVSDRGREVGCLDVCAAGRVGAERDVGLYRFVHGHAG